MVAITALEAKNDDCLADLDRKLLVRPLEFILADHLRQRDLCRLFEQLAGGVSLDLALADAIAAYLADDMAIHLLDEEENLFPLLRRRCRAEDDVEKVLGLLSREHARDANLVDIIIPGLRIAVVMRAAALDDDLKAALREFAYRQRRHLAVENAIVMPLAEKRLSPRDREGLARRMAVRRGVHLRIGDAA